MTDDEIRAWLTREIATEDRHIRTETRESSRRHCVGRRSAFQELLAVLDRATRKATEDCQTCEDVVYAEGAK